MNAVARIVRMARGVSLAALVALIGIGLHAHAAANADEGVSELQHEWAVIKYQVPEVQRVPRFEVLAAKAQKVTDSHAGHSEAWVWHAVIVSSWAEAIDDLSALGLAKKAKAMYEQALRIDASAPDGAAYTGLGALHHKVPGWPLSFGDDDKARELLQKALALNPQGIDANYYYGELLAGTKRRQDALPYLERAQQAPARPGREIADAGRREEARALIDKIKAR